MSTRGSSLRRRRSDIEDEEDADIIRSSQRSTPSTPDSRKRPRNHASDSDTPPETPEHEGTAVNPLSQPINGGGTMRNVNLSQSDDGEESGASKFQPGAIVRVKLKNFVTYAETTFWPGPNLNMIIGPNGTGKSSLVCAICLGLGWGPQHLGRGGQIGEFVKHGLDTAYIEIELQCRDNETENNVVRLKIIRDGNGREWFLNGKKTSLKAIQTLTKSLSIQIDNLCQFLPQDKVSEFAALSPVDLLMQTQRAAAPEQMLEWHEELKKKRKDQKLVEEQLDRDKEQLGTLETRQDNLRAEVQRLEERNQIQETVELLKKSIPFVEYREVRAQHKAARLNKKVAESRLNHLNKQVEPTLQQVNKKEEYVAQLGQIIREREQILQKEERGAEQCLKEIDLLSKNLQENEQKLNAENSAQNKRKVDEKRFERALSDLKARAREPEPEFHAPEYNERIRLKESEHRRLISNTTDVRSQYNILKQHGTVNQDQIALAKEGLAEFDSQQGQLQHKLESFSRDTAKAWLWVQENKGEFEKEVFGPPIVTCSIKDPRYTAAVESLLGKNDVLALTAQSPNDFRKLQNQVLGASGLGLMDVTIRSVSQTLAQVNRSIRVQDELQQCGLDGSALDFIDGPEPVLAMLCTSKNISAAGVALRDISEEQHQMLVNSSCSSWVAGRSFNKVTKRAEYGPGATSTLTNIVKDPKWWTNAPIDTSARREIEAKIIDLTQHQQELGEQARPLQNTMKEAQAKLIEIKEEIATIKAEKSTKQKSHGEWAALPVKIQNAEEALEKKVDEGKTIRERIKLLRTQHDHAVLRKVDKVLKHKDRIDVIRRCHHELIDIRIRLIEGESDVESLKERNRDIVERLAIEKSLVDEASRLLQAAKARGDEVIKVVYEITAEAKAAGNFSYFENMPDDKSVDSLEAEIAAEESKLDYIHANNPHAIRDFERRQAEVDKLNAKIVDFQDKLDKLARSIMKIRGRWEPELDKLITEISDAFSHNFEQIGCAGEVGIHKDDDFDQWSIEIKVKFRENETLQILDQHRQSGGERSVSTIFYLMSLQSLARAPFRVVDEINQGMDPRNERMVHERMVEIACKEHTSQYFLITPKLLTGLRYDKRMKVHCIASGEHMPQDHRKMDVQKILAIRRAIIATG